MFGFSPTGRRKIGQKHFSLIGKLILQEKWKRGKMLAQYPAAGRDGNVILA